jgi:hypothetical protein
MSDIMETETEPLTVDKLDEYLQAAAGIVEELRHFLSGHYADLTLTKHEPNKWGYAGRIHSLKMACDSFINAMRGNF